MTGRLVTDQLPAFLERQPAIIRDRPFLVAVVGALALSILSLLVFTSRYETNDDVTMNLIAAGLLFADRPDEHLLFSNVLVGLPLRSLYSQAPDVPWYALYQLVTITLAGTATCYALLRVNPRIGQALVAVLFLAVGILPCVVELQFTKTAFLASFSGLLLVLAPLRGASPWPRAADIAGYALIIWGSLIRFESFLMAVVVAAPLVAVAARASPMRAFRRAVPLVLAAAFAVALNLYNRDYYARDSGWKDFYDYNAARAEFTDYMHFRYTPESENSFRAAGWQKIDFYMMLNWFFADPERFSLDKLRQIIATAPREKVPPAGEKLQEILQNLSRFPRVLAVMLAVCCGACLTGSAWSRFIVPALLFAFGMGLILLMAMYLWLPPRVAFPLFVGVLAASALRPQPDGGLSTRRQVSVDKALRLGAALAACGLIVWTLHWTVVEQDRERVPHEGMLRVMRILKSRRDQLFILWREWFPLEKLVYPLEDTRGLRDFRCVSWGTLTPTPLTQRRLRDFNITDICRATWERPDVLLVAMPQLVQLLRIYIVTHYKVETTERVLFSTEGNASFLPEQILTGSQVPLKFGVYQLRAVREAADPAAPKPSRP